MKNLNKSTVLTSIESINRTMKKNCENNFKNIGTKCTQLGTKRTQFRKRRGFFFAP
jgi:hypothetical protein